MVARALAKAYESFLLAAVSMAFDMVSTKFAALSSCCRTVVLLAAANVRLSRAVPKRSRVVAGVGRTELAPPSGSSPQAPVVGAGV